ncbi:ATP-dependent RNA helicase HrpA [Arcanobacterium pinnipediorum]|uniref:ATP-dependent RNA helicase HrpA n=1 Tax=Arcanobacterium pinnipediorum TaxID=1503041 RepID=A0ABY5AHE6_9ACTO|nr:ATP-dependent RNA helicase HrpA [Arcanobacterium pinnipediorum]USR79507.1 ATP-dependent RNA helicase HrpA [Arcanobacterium pinnipediorum]
MSENNRHPNSQENSRPRRSAAHRRRKNHQHQRALRGPRPFTPEQLAARRAIVPAITYPAQLPVSARRADIMAAIKDNQVVIIAGETGSGKTTQLPKMCLELGRGITGMIGHTQPRRIAARSVAQRICDELDVELGGPIGYHVRFTEEVSPTTLVKLMTDGILLAEIQSDPMLRRYDTIIIDEAHERSLNIDFLMGYLAQLLSKRPDLKLIITSATIDSQRFAQHFGKFIHNGGDDVVAPVIEVSGRTFPVEIRYRPLDGETRVLDGETETLPGGENAEYLSREEAHDQITGIIDAAEELMSEGPGDILVFLSGEGEIRETFGAFKDELGNRFIEPGGHSTVPGAVEIMPLYARLSAGEQQRIFQPHNNRRIVLATNIAETSLTVPGIRYVIDPGTARISRYSPRTKVQRLPIEAISQASANQRSGRCGRVADGIAIRLYSEEDFAARPDFTEPEIQRTSLAAVILQMASLGLGTVADFPFIDPPDLKSVRAGIQLLEEIGALEPDMHTPVLTKIGQKLARLPIDPRLARMLLAAVDNGAATEVLVLVAAMSVQDVRERPAEFKAQADQLHARFTEPSSDFLAYLNLWRYLRTQQRDLSGSAFRRMCRAEHLNWLRFREWQDVVAQLRELAKPLGITLKNIALPTAAQIQQARDKHNDVSQNRDVVHAVKAVGASADAPAADAIHRSLLVGLLSNVGSYDQRKRDYLGARGTHFVTWPGSGLARRTPDWVMAAELVETSRLFARTVAKIDPAWIERVGAHLVKRTYSDPFWSSRDGAAKVHEKVLLYGLTVTADRHVLLSSIGTPSARELAREIFIRHALVEGQWRSHHQFIKANAAALADAREVEERLRSHGLVADEAAQFVFFDERIPESIVSGRHFDSWWKKERHNRPDLLTFTREFLLGENDASNEDFPTEWMQGEVALPISYTFVPGSHADGLCIDVPVTLLPQLSDDGFDWLVPGMRDELVVATIRGLPKRIRRHLVPAPDVAREVGALLPRWEEVAHGQPGAPSFRAAFSDAVRVARGIEIDDEAWEQADLPPHLVITFRVRSERGAVLEEATSIEYLQRSLAPQTRTAVESVVKNAVSQAVASAGGAGGTGSRTTPSHTPGELADNTALGAHIGQVLSTWPQTPDGTIPDSVESIGSHGMVIRGYPALVAVPVKEGTGVELQIVAEPAEQMRDHRLGIIRLLAQELRLPDARISSRWTGRESLAMAASPYSSTTALIDDLHLAAARNLADRWAREEKQPIGQIRRVETYTELRTWLRDRIEDEIYRVAQIVVRILEAYGEVDSLIRTTKSLALINTVTDVRDHVSSLVRDGFIAGVPEEYLAQIPRYLRGAQIRLEKAGTNPAEDSLAWQIADISEAVAQEQQADIAYDPQRSAQLEKAQWMIEELRVSFFAQQLGTHGKVSVQRIRKLLG